MEVTRAWQVMSAIHSYIATHKDADGNLNIKDDKTGETLPLDFVEIHNPGHDFDYPDFPGPEMQAVEALCLDILSRHSIPPDRVLAHSDIAPGRKRDPGEKFDWQRLAHAGIGLWVAPAPLGSDQGLGPGDEGESVAELQRALLEYGYGVEVTSTYGTGLEKVVEAFQRHFRPARVDGRADLSTRDTLARLLKARRARDETKGGQLVTSKSMPSKV